ncbi:hypothetical protein RS022_00210 [Candidatus Phytoplasma rubi]|uniref:Uncharacterized protein n=1 Tax=Candidatus Phytoplasma rubi TaxID=399025 RepID=A0ABY7BQZ6_9MOLU|nr:hypothetical protein [Candidatus Phytoplasma rubi]WAN63034.1 hypothetical protein RS022_00210 [Candidatus Phytoplasma rubi]
MNNNNFFKKHLVIIIIIIIGSAIIIFYQGRNDIKKEKEELFSPEKEIENNDSSSSSYRSKRKTEKPKFTITEARFDKIKSYVLSENNNQTLLLNDLSEIEKIEIEKIRECRKQTLGFIKRHKNTINEKNKECNNLREQLQPLYHQIETLKKQLTPLEKEQNSLEEKIKNKKYRRAEISPIYHKIYEQRNNIKVTNLKPLNESENKKLEDEIGRLQDEVIKLVSQISYIKRDIGNLEADQRMYENMLSNAIKLRDSLQRQYYKSEKEYQNQINSLLNSLYEITSVEGKK